MFIVVLLIFVYKTLLEHNSYYVLITMHNYALIVCQIKMDVPSKLLKDEMVGIII